MRIVLMTVVVFGLVAGLVAQTPTPTPRPLDVNCREFVPRDVVVQGLGLYASDPTGNPNPAALLLEELDANHPTHGQTLDEAVWAIQKYELDRRCTVEQGGKVRLTYYTREAGLPPYQTLSGTDPNDCMPFDSNEVTYSYQQDAYHTARRWKVLERSLTAEPTPHWMLDTGGMKYDNHMIALHALQVIRDGGPPGLRRICFVGRDDPNRYSEPNAYPALMLYFLR